MQLTSHLYELKPFEQIDFDLKIHLLKESLYGKTKFEKIIH